MLSLRYPDNYLDSENLENYSVSYNRAQKIEFLKNRLNTLMRYIDPKRCIRCLDHTSKEVIDLNPDPDYSDNPDYIYHVEAYEILNTLKRIDWLEFKKVKSSILKILSEIKELDVNRHERLIDRFNPDNVKKAYYTIHKKKGKGYTREFRKILNSCLRKHKPHRPLKPNPDPEISIKSRYFEIDDLIEPIPLSNNDNRIINDDIDNKPNPESQTIEKTERIRLKPIQKYIQGYGENYIKDNLDYIENCYLDWVKNNEAIIIEKYEQLIDRKTWLWLKASKRGNDVYQARVTKTLNNLIESITNLSNVKNCRNPELKISNMLSITLTYDTKLSNLTNAWKIRISKDWNKFLSSLRQEYGKIEIARSYESFESGYPHIHALIVFREKQFLLHQYINPDRFMTWRISDTYRKKIQKLWHSNIDIKGISTENIKEALFNILQYIMKTKKELDDPDTWNKIHLRTMSLTWFTNKRAFAISKGLPDLINAICITQIANTVQTDLYGQKLPVTYTLIGIITYQEVKINPNIWYTEYKERPNFLDRVKPICNSMSSNSLSQLENMFKM